MTRPGCWWAPAGVDPDMPALRGVVIHRRGRVTYGDKAIGADVLDQDGFWERGDEDQRCPVRCGRVVYGGVLPVVSARAIRRKTSTGLY